jgi:hypothetical protein
MLRTIGLEKCVVVGDQLWEGRLGMRRWLGGEVCGAGVGCPGSTLVDRGGRRQNACGWHLFRKITTPWGQVKQEEGGGRRLGKGSAQKDCASAGQRCSSGTRVGADALKGRGGIRIWRPAVRLPECRGDLRSAAWLIGCSSYTTRKSKSVGRFLRQHERSMATTQAMTYFGVEAGRRYRPGPKWRLQESTAFEKIAA